MFVWHVCRYACLCGGNWHRAGNMHDSTFSLGISRETGLFHFSLSVLTSSQDCQREEFYSKLFEKPQIERMISIDHSSMGDVVCD